MGKVSHTISIVTRSWPYALTPYPTAYRQIPATPVTAEVTNKSKCDYIPGLLFEESVIKLVFYMVLAFPTLLQPSARVSPR